MKNRVLFLTFSMSLIGLCAKAQYEKVKIDEHQIRGGATKSQAFLLPLTSEITALTSDLKWKPTLTKKTVEFEPKVPNEEVIEQIKSYKTKLANPSTNRTSSEGSIQTFTPLVGTNYMGNINNASSPLDNNIAISNSGIIVSVANTTIEIDNMSGTNLFYKDLVTFINDPAITSVCDPVVLYDSGSDRFVFFCQESPLSNTSHILIFFSKTNNPSTGGWWYYKFAGDPTGAGDAFDYPKIAVSNDELFITGNLFSEPSGLFHQAIVFQMNKVNGYAGGTINWDYYSGITGNPFTLLPVSYGQNGTYGPGIYMVSTDNSGSSTLHLFEITSNISGTPLLNSYSVSTTAYSPTGYNASQLGSSTDLIISDCRALSGFYLNGIIHFVFHSDIGNAWYGINYNRLNVSQLTNQSSMYGVSGSYDYAYPSVASYANTATDKSVMIGFGRSGPSIYPEIRVVNCDNAMSWSNSTLVKGSASYVSYTGSHERWGDYTGIARKHTSAISSVWMNGMYGTPANVWNTWVAEIHSSGIANIDESAKTNTVNIFPNPIAETFTIDFYLKANTVLSIEILDITGKLIKELYNGKGIEGENNFSFNKSNLASGTYFLVIKNDKTIFKNEKIIVAN